MKMKFYEGDTISVKESRKKVEIAYFKGFLRGILSQYWSLYMYGAGLDRDSWNYVQMLINTLEELE